MKTRLHERILAASTVAGKPFDTGLMCLMLSRTLVVMLESVAGICQP
jgi:hypothetical protein